jgi:soluble lytic murein transglycosylase-like protein
VQSLIRQASRRHNLDVHLLAALIRHESAFNPAAVSHAGARGLMQLMPGTAARYGVARVHDPGENIAGGSAYLRDLLDMFGRVDLALAAYNAGEGAVLRHGRQIPPFPETQNYVRVVLAEYDRRRTAAAP